MTMAADSSVVNDAYPDGQLVKAIGEDHVDQIWLADEASTIEDMALA